MSSDSPTYRRIPNPIEDDMLRMSAHTALLGEMVAERLGINGTDIKCLCLIDREGIMTAGELADLTGLTTGAVTGLLDRLERAGFLQRTRDAQDRRRVLVHVVPDSIEQRIDPLFAEVRARFTALWSRYSPQELLVLQDFFKRSHEIIREERNRLRDAAP